MSANAGGTSGQESIEQTADLCEDCGICCLHVNCPPLLPEERERLPKSLRVEIDGYLDSIRYEDKDWPCIWFDRSTGKCRHYEHRPEVCREFEPGGEGCNRMRAEASVAALAHGEVWPKPKGGA